MKENFQATRQETISYPDASVLLRPQQLEGRARPLVLALLVVAIIIGAACIYKAADVFYFSIAKSEAQVTLNATRDIDYQMPSLTNYVGWSDDEIINNLTEENGYSLYYYSSESDYPNGGFDVLKLPSDVAYEQASSMLEGGLSSLNAENASLLLNGSYRLTLDLSNYFDFRVRYVDFKSGSISAAIEAACVQQGFTGDAVEVTEEGTDDNGNVYRAGTIESSDKTIQWRVSAIDAQYVYDIKGLPEDAVYVGVRITY